ncbi:hypothetical protein EVAR_24208_1 [Eumeta japonica]|uniref:Uncharacterized protein n=1 Tax=Eumeta variegata TaxID=151549 RepID=A0A4C1W795_EUMVA|nr:hypothetical protein EVAR_24208_1 [Eumeta japonica]
MSHRTRERPAECLASLSHSTMIVVDSLATPSARAGGAPRRRRPRIKPLTTPAKGAFDLDRSSPHGFIPDNV